MKRSLVLCLLSALGLLGTSRAAQAIIWRHDVGEAAYLTLATQSQFDPVGNFGFGTGTLISSEWVLTAGHCIPLVSVGSTTFTVGGVAYVAAEAIAHPGWNGVLEHGADIGLVRLAKPVTGITPATLYTGSDELGKSVVSVGFGATGNGLTGNTGGTSLKHACENVLEKTSNFLVTPPSTTWSNDYLVADFDTPTLASTRLTQFGSSNSPLALEGSISFGDSGGGTFLNDGGVWKLAGVHSWIDGLLSVNGVAGDGTDNSSYTDLYGVTRVSNFTGWINSTVAASAPEPSTLGLLALGGALLSRRRRSALR